MDPVSTEEKKKSFLDTKEGTWGLIIPVALIVAGIFFQGPILAGVAVMFAVLGAGVAYGILAAIALFLIHGFFIDGWLALKYQVFCKNLRKSIIDENPLTILKIWMDRAIKRMKEIREGIGLVAGKKKETEQVHNSFKEDFVKFQREAKHYESVPEKQAEFRSACGRMAKAAEMIKETAKDLAIVTSSHAKLTEAYKELEVMMADMKYEESALVRKYQTSGALDAVWGRMRALFKGETEDDLLRAEAIESINTKYAERMGRVETAMNDCQGKIDGMKAKREMQETDGMEMFNQLKNANVDSLSYQPTASIGYSPATTVATPVSSYATVINK